MMYNCCSCACNKYKTQSVTVVGSNLVLDLGKTPKNTLVNGQTLNFIICQDIPALSKPIPIAFKINGVVYVAITNKGNRVYSDQLLKCKCYHMTFATDTQCPVVNSYNLCPTDYVFPTIQGSVPSTEEV